MTKLVSYYYDYYSKAKYFECANHCFVGKRPFKFIRGVDIVQLETGQAGYGQEYER
jgi:hypothetical protein